MNLANQVTLARLLLSVIYFVLLAIASASPQPSGMLLDAAFVLFVVAAFTDFLDGYLARRLGIITSFGRVADPFADKILVCGSLVFLTSAPATAPFLPAWMVVAILAREFIVHGVRSHAEARGWAFGASFWGKIKMTFQCVTIGGLLLHWGRFREVLWLEATDRALVWVSLISTVVSGIVYIWEAREVLSPGPPVTDDAKK
jgi:CDP-diacylglycerol--glycerol-3-phosphate 3-phosphatidyltransferase